MTTRWLLAAGLAATLSTSAGAAETLHALMEDVPETAIIEAMLPDFQKETGITVAFEKLGYPDMHDKLVAQLSGGESAYQVLEVDFLWAGEFPAAGWLEPLQPYVEKSGFDLAPFLPSMLELVGRHDGTLYMIPMYNYTMGLIHRTDLAPVAPVTLADYVATAKRMKQTGIAGAAMQGQRGDPNSMEFSNYLFSAGGAYLDAGGKVSLDAPATREALRLYVDAITGAAQQGALSATLDDTMRLMCDGQAFSMVTYWWMLPQLDDAKKCPKVAGKLALSVMPGGHGESGGWGWAVPKNVPAATKDAAWRFISWVQSAKISRARALQGHAPVRTDTFRDADVLKAYPFYAQAEQVVASGRPFPVFTYSAQYEDVLGTQLSLAASGETSPDAAVTAAAKGLESLLAKER